MSNLLDEIVQVKLKKLERQKQLKPIRELEKEASSRPEADSLIRKISVKGELSIIAEMKRQSPSAGNLTGASSSYDPASLAKEYESSGARALSVLTEEDYFKGSSADFIAVKKESKLPALRKDFMIDPYQIVESKILGASAVLLIIACLKEERYLELYRLARDLKMEVVVEVHSKQELEVALKNSPNCVGINNRDLKTLKTDVRTTFNLFGEIPRSVTVISESGIGEPETIRELKDLGVQAALIGESILKSADRSKKLSELVSAGKN